MRWRRIAAIARAGRPAAVSSTPWYGLWSTSPRSASRFTVAVTVPGDTRGLGQHAGVGAPSRERR